MSEIERLAHDKFIYEYSMKLAIDNARVCKQKDPTNVLLKEACAELRALTKKPRLRGF